MKVYHCPQSRSLRVIWLAEEMGLEIDVQTLGFPPRVREPSYFDINPTATIPAFFDGDVAMFESIAIIEHLAETHGPTDLVVPPGDPERPHYLNFLHMGEATLVPPLTKIVRYRMLEPKERRAPQVAQDGGDEFIDRLQHVTARLQGREWLSGDRFTLADISVGYAVHLGDFLKLGERMTPEVQAYVTRIRSRPAFQRAFART
jgi:glutathione S-transferase